MTCAIPGAAPRHRPTLAWQTFGCSGRAKNANFNHSHASSLTPGIRELTEMLAGIADAVNSVAPSCEGLPADQLLPELRINLLTFLSVHEPGIQYVQHIDAPMQQKNARCLTVLAYVNPEWSQGDGGELRVFYGGDNPPTDYAPLAGRVILFKSRDVFHSVQPAVFRRCAVQIWLLGD